MSNKETPKGCACTQNLQDLLRAAAPKKVPLRKTTCLGCGKVFWTNTNIDHCFDCQTEKKKEKVK